MITGNNTDVSYNGRTYHVQTEDRGDEKPTVESLVYCQGEILGTRKTGYTPDADQKTIMGIVEKQHMGLIREVRNGLWSPEGPRLVGEDCISDRGLDDVVAEYLAGDPGMDRVHLAVDAEPALAAGGTSVLRVRALEDGDDGRPAASTFVTVRMVAPGAPTVVLAEGETDGEGWFRCEVRPGIADSGALIVTSGAVGGGQLRLPLKRSRPQKN